jgi:hypothetical protein
MAAGSITAGEVVSVNLPDNVPTVSINTSVVPSTTSLLSQYNVSLLSKLAMIHIPSVDFKRFIAFIHAFSG